ncbi:hypothetical protein ALC57_17004 [Trachymyrmex cornetzi]|uniref:Uncharacterized protein n=1 Tax=Trachymyrmex cornetzi TaxID=471704 RepID=A0A195DEF2_9HYME|nr:hypothetical protein ALC57_17004 [Trachymyrmex cornetzi]
MYSYASFPRTKTKYYENCIAKLLLQDAYVSLLWHQVVQQVYVYSCTLFISQRVTPCSKNQHLLTNGFQAGTAVSNRYALSADPKSAFCTLAASGNSFGSFNEVSWQKQRESIYKP